MISWIVVNDLGASIVIWTLEDFDKIMSDRGIPSNRGGGRGVEGSEQIPLERMY